jgi:cysteine synthase
MVIIMPSNMSEERKKMFKYYGATLIEVDEGDFDGAIELKR